MKKSLKEFVIETFKIIENKDFICKPCHDYIFPKLEETVESYKKNVIITMPPRCGLTTILNYYIAWVWGQGIRFKYSSYSKSLYSHEISRLSEILLSALFKGEDYKIARGLLSLDENISRAIPFTRLTSNMGLTGHGGLICDTPFSPTQHLNENEIDYVFKNLESQGALSYRPVIIGTSRFGESDLVEVIKSNKRLSPKFTFIEINSEELNFGE